MPATAIILGVVTSLRTPPIMKMSFGGLPSAVGGLFTKEMQWWGQTLLFPPTGSANQGGAYERKIGVKNKQNSRA